MKQTFSQYGQKRLYNLLGKCSCKYSQLHPKMFCCKKRTGLKGTHCVRYTSARTKGQVPM